MHKNQQKPARGRWVLLSLAVLVAGLVLFTGILRHLHRSPSVLNPADYVLQKPEAFRYACSANSNESLLTVDGWACLEGEGLYSINCWVVLYDTVGKSYTRIPTMYRIDEAATQAIDDGREYGRAGYSSFVARSQLQEPLSRYEICFAYRNNTHNLLVHTGQTLEA